MSGSTVDLFVMVSAQTLEECGTTGCYIGYNITRWQEFFQFHYNLMEPMSNKQSVFVRCYAVHDSIARRKEQLKASSAAPGACLMKLGTPGVHWRAEEIRQVTIKTGNWLKTETAHGGSLRSPQSSCINAAMFRVRWLGYQSWDLVGGVVLIPVYYWVVTVGRWVWLGK